MNRRTLKPTLVMYCQHSLGMGHLVRSLQIAAALAGRFAVTFVNGGRWPSSHARPAAHRVVDLPPVGMTPDGQLQSLDPARDVASAMLERRIILQSLARRLNPAALLIEMYPFGRKKFAAEVEALLAAAPQAIAVCSVRDILVANRQDQQRHDDRAARILNRRFDCVIVHADENFARLEETFRPAERLRIPVHYSGFVTQECSPANPCGARTGMLVSAGGGAEGAGLLQLALSAQPELLRSTGLATTMVAGPFLPESAWQDLQRQAQRRPGITLLREVPNLQNLMRRAAVSVSQCGYNTAMDIVQSATRALVVPFMRLRETEQLERAQRLARLGLVALLEPAAATPRSLAQCVQALRSTNSVLARSSLRTQGAAATVAILDSLLAARRYSTLASSCT